MLWTDLEHSHGIDDSLLDGWLTVNVKRHEEVGGHSHQGILGPALEPVHCAARDESGKLQGPVTELLSHLHDWSQRQSKTRHCGPVWYSVVYCVGTVHMNTKTGHMKHWWLI